MLRNSPGFVHCCQRLKKKKEEEEKGKKEREKKEKENLARCSMIGQSCTEPDTPAMGVC